MRRITATAITIMITAACGAWMSAQSTDGSVVEGVSVSDPVIEHSRKFLRVGMEIDLSELKVTANRAVLLTPHLVTETDSMDLPSIGIYGRQRYYFYVRNGKGMLSEEEESYKWKDKPDSVSYSRLLDYPEWAKGSMLQLHLRRSDYGCCNTLIDEEDGLVCIEAIPYYPQLIYKIAEGEPPVKERSIRGSAFIDFVVDRTDIRESYRNNVGELGKIRASIDSVRNDSDITITEIWLKGYASPEGVYSHNIDLAKGRTTALKEYIQKLYGLEDSLITTSYEPEDWEGLRRYVESSDLEHRGAILDIIDGDLEPDPKDAKIKSAYPKEYAYLLKNVYPALRHTDYEVDYTIREYTKVEDLQAVYETHPDRLSPNEYYLLSRQYEPESAEFARIFRTAVRYYPEDEISNLNAANAALSEYDFEAAAQYLGKAGESAEAQYSRGVYAYWTGDYETAAEYIGKAEEAGLEEAAEALDVLKNTDRNSLEASRQAALDEIDELK